VFLGACELKKKEKFECKPRTIGFPKVDYVVGKKDDAALKKRLEQLTPADVLKLLDAEIKDAEARIQAAHNVCINEPN
jgi:hypothetical protein